MSLNAAIEPAARETRPHLPCVDRSVACAILEVDNWQLEALIDSGKLGGVIDIASHRSHKRIVRFCTACLEAYKAAQNSEAEIPDYDTTQLMELIFGTPEKLVAARRIYTRLNCQPAHLYALIDQQVIKIPKHFKRRTGPGGSVVVPWKSLRRFIAQRRIE